MRLRSAVEVVDGELVEFSGKRNGPKLAADSTSVRARIAALGKQMVYSEFLGYAEERGKKEGLAAHLYREIFGVWPRGLSAEPLPASGMVRSWIRSRNIAWARRRDGRNVNPRAAL